jgi:hypothetical protein
LAEKFFLPHSFLMAYLHKVETACFFCAYCFFRRRYFPERRTIYCVPSMVYYRNEMYKMQVGKSSKERK